MGSGARATKARRRHGWLFDAFRRPELDDGSAEVRARIRSGHSGLDNARAAVMTVPELDPGRIKSEDGHD
jgi:hypothetical protein